MNRNPIILKLGRLGLPETNLNKVALVGLMVLSLALGYASGWYKGHNKGYDKGHLAGATLIKSSTFVASFSALNMLRDGNLSDAIQRLEPHCFSAAADILETPGLERDLLLKLYVADLKRYRKAFPIPPVQSYPTEKLLERLLGTAKQ
jgi:hypothetical protein